MAIRHRPERRSPFQVYWNNPFSKRRESQDFFTLTEAEKFDSLVKHRLKHDRESFKTDWEPEKNVPENCKPTLEECYYEYLKEKQFSKKSLAWSLDGMKAVLSLIGGVEIEEIDKNMLNDVLKSLSEKAIKPITVRNRMGALRAVMRWCVQKDLLAVCPIFPQLPPARHERFIPPTPDEIRTMLGVAPPHMQRVIILGSQLGARIGASELFRLLWSDVDLQRGVARIQAAKKNPHEPWREVPLRGALRSILQVWQEEDTSTGAHYVINYHGKPISSVKTAWRNILRDAGITRRMRPYDLRHAFATEMIAAGVDVGTVSRLMGHTTPTMVLTHYQHVLDKQKLAAVEALPDIPHVSKFHVSKN